MFELSVALNYLIPRLRQLSVSIISLISIGVISLVVWLIVVFFSVTHGLEQGWIEKLIALTAPVRVTPTEAYYSSYYYKVDSIAEQSDYTLKSVEEKLISLNTDPYDPEVDPEIPLSWEPPFLDGEGNLADLVKLASQSIQTIEGVTSTPYSVAPCHLRHCSPAAKSYPILLNAYDPENRYFKKSLITSIDPSFSIEPDPHRGEPLFLPKGFKQTGFTLNQSVELLFFSPTPTTLEQEKITGWIAGFYDPGILPMGNQLVIGNQEVAMLIKAAHADEDTPMTNGINVKFDHLSRAEQVKNTIQQRFEHLGIAPYWNVQTYEDYPFVKDFLQQLKSEKHLFSLLACVIMLVACSNIVSMLIILVNDKQAEIGILRAMGASKKSIALIFGICGLLIGLMGSALGIILALFTLNHLDTLLHLIGTLQGFELLNAHFYGETIPNALSWEALFFVFSLTTVISLISGVVPAIKSCLVEPSITLRGGK